MRTLTIVVLLLSFSALAQTRVKENIKQQVIATTEDGAHSVKAERPVKSR